MKTSVYIGTSLDGFIARKDGAIEWLMKYQNREVGESYEEFIKDIDAIVIGRGTYEKVAEFPDWLYNKPVFVLSNSLKQLPDALKGKATLLAMKPKEVLSHLAAQGFSHAYIDGGKVIQSFLRDDCIDDLIITKVPELIGSGIPLFGDLANDLQFKHTRTDVLSNGLVKSRYERVRG